MHRDRASRSLPPNPFLYRALGPVLLGLVFVALAPPSPARMDPASTRATPAAAAASGEDARDESPAQMRIRKALADTARATSAPQRARAWLALAAAHTARARETGDGSHYERSLQALEHARAAGGGEDLAKIEAWVRLGRHEFEAARRLARQHLDARPEDPEAWGLLGDALMELGRTEPAGDAYQRMMDLRPGPGAYLRAAYYRERTEDLEGAGRLLEWARAATPLRERGQLAWIDVQHASIETRLGRRSEARRRLTRALDHFPEYHYALAAMAALDLEEDRPEAALELARRALAGAPHAERWLLVADALRELGRESEARAAEDRFEGAARAHVDAPDNENRYLLDFYLHRRPDPARAREIADELDR